MEEEGKVSGGRGLAGEHREQVSHKPVLQQKISAAIDGNWFVLF